MTAATYDRQALVRRLPVGRIRTVTIEEHTTSGVPLGRCFDVTGEVIEHGQFFMVLGAHPELLVVPYRAVRAVDGAEV